MKLIQLQYMKSVATTGSFSMSARMCGVSQPTISNAISDLEDELQAKIFLRTTRCVELTAFGENIIAHVDSILGEVEQIKHEAETYSRPEQRVLRVAFSPVVDSRRLIGVFNDFATHAPGTGFIYKECSVGECESLLNHDKLDLVCGVGIHDAAPLCRCVLYHDVLRFLPQGGGNSDHRQSTVSLSDIHKETFITTVDDCGLAPMTRELFHRQCLNFQEYPGHPLSYRVVQEWVCEGIGSAILPESKIIGDPSIYPVVVELDAPASLAVEAVWVRSNRAPYAKAFVRYIKEASSSAVVPWKPAPLKHNQLCEFTCSEVTERR